MPELMAGCGVFLANPTAIKIFFEKVLADRSAFCYSSAPVAKRSKQKREAGE
ncbi:hypothetical protein [Noviherbaspirillum sp. Root189]|uniref:hypothetical protein n=1 Tax=Noviherbaspirillum sp. Root189 TaxID=1736487 RepID=UPI0012E3CD20|nr:hypothetical protein [Noviherbaspirillum sp. Root189]